MKKFIMVKRFVGMVIVSLALPWLLQNDKIFDVQVIQDHESAVLLIISKWILSRLLNLIWIQLPQWSQRIAMSDILTVFRETLHMSVIVDNTKSMLSQLQKSL